MTKAPISLQDLRRSLYVKAKAEPPWRFWGCAGINRHVVANERVVQERRSESILAPNLAVNIARC